MSVYEFEINNNMTTNLKVEKKNIPSINLISKRVSWNSKRKYNYKYVTTVF